jgi:hypothetical protein
MFELETKILDMLSDGKITADEATELLRAVGVKRNHCDDTKKNGCDFKRKLDKFYNGVNSFVCDAKNEIKGMKPKVASATRCVLKKTSKLIQEVSDKLTEVSDKMEKNAENNSSSSSSFNLNSSDDED